MLACLLMPDNFSLIQGEPLKRGKRVIRTDGATAYGDGSTYGGMVDLS